MQKGHLKKKMYGQYTNLTIRASLATRYILFLAIFGRDQRSIRASLATRYILYLAIFGQRSIRASLRTRYTLFLAIFGQGQLQLCWQPVTHYFWPFLVKS